MKRKEFKKITVRKNGKQYDVHAIADGRFFEGRPAGTIVVKNPLYNGEPEYLYFSPSEIEPVYEEKNTGPWFKGQKERQDREVKDE